MPAKKSTAAQNQQFLDTLSAVEELLRPCASAQELAALEKQREDFRAKLDDLNRENRQLSIGVVGQVKAGKSSFLNSLLFNGEEVLPTASTPKTATLTRMEYGEENVMEIEYYSAREWEEQKRLASYDLDGDVYTAARELVKMANARVLAGTLNVQRCLDKGRERLTFGAYEELTTRLNDYVGEDGVYTPLVKAVSLSLHNERFRDRSIVDTPGLNDPIVSRTERTKEYLKICDVVFFLSESSSFLTSSDWELLSAQIPMSGVRRLVLIASKYDNGLVDVLRPRAAIDSPFAQGSDESHTDNLLEACQIVTGRLSSRARSQVNEQKRCLEGSDLGEGILKVIDSCKAPIFFSTMACRMSRKAPEAYTPAERYLYEKLSRFSRDIQADLVRIGDLAPIEEILEEIQGDKETILEEKTQNLASDSRAILRLYLTKLSEQAAGKHKILSNNDCKQLQERKQAIEQRQNQIRASISDVFSKYIDHLKTSKQEGVAELRSASTAHGKLTTKTGSRKEDRTRTVSASTWYKPWTWFKTETQHYSVTVNYTYLASSEAAEQLSLYAKESATEIESRFTKALSLQQLRQNLCGAVLKTMDLSDARFDSAYFRLRVNQLLDEIVFPTIHMDTSAVTEQCLSDFSGQVTKEADMERLRSALHHGLELLFQELCRQFERETSAFLSQLQTINREFQETLLVSVREELDALIQQLSQKKAELAKLQAYLSCLKCAIERVA